MGVFRRKVPTHCVPVHPDNIRKNDWIILLEAGTIVGASAEKLRSLGPLWKENRNQIQYFVACAALPGFGGV